MRKPPTYSGERLTWSLIEELEHEGLNDLSTHLSNVLVDYERGRHNVHVYIPGPGGSDGHHFMQNGNGRCEDAPACGCCT